MLVRCTPENGRLNKALNSKAFRVVGRILIIQLALVAAFVVNAFAQPAGTNRRLDDTRRMINNDNWRELMKVDREHPGSAPAGAPDAGLAVLLKQMRDDFKSLQEVNNKMMADA